MNKKSRNVIQFPEEQKKKKLNLCKKNILMIHEDRELNIRNT